MLKTELRVLIERGLKGRGQMTRCSDRPLKKPPAIKPSVN